MGGGGGRGLGVAGRDHHLFRGLVGPVRIDCSRFNHFLNKDSPLAVLQRGLASLGRCWIYVNVLLRDTHFGSIFSLVHLFD